MNKAAFKCTDDAVLFEQAGPVGTVTLNRPSRHNAFDETLIAGLSDALRHANADEDIRVIILTGAGASFSAGGDLNWMKRMAGFTREQNIADAKSLATLLQLLNGTAKPTLGLIRGNVFGGGVGLAACCDIAIAAEDAVFCLPECRLGLISAVISPYVIEAIGPRAARRYFLTGERFDSATALRIGLIHETAPAAELESRRDTVIRQILQNSPAAITAGKALIRDFAFRPIDRAMIEDTASRLADARASADGREGVAAFLEKRKPAWAV